MKDGELGFSGNRDFSVLYELTEENGLRITYDVVSDADTILNLTNHCYFNLDGHGAGQITDHELQLFSHAYTPADAEFDSEWRYFTRRRYIRWTSQSRI